MRFVRYPAVTASLLAGLSVGSAFAQAGLRGSDNAGDFPGSPTVAPPLSPESNAPPTTQSSSAASDASSPRAPFPDGSGTPNYGRRRPPRPKLYAPNLRSNPPLSPLVPYVGAPGTRQRAPVPVALPNGQTRGATTNAVPAPPAQVDVLPPPPNVAVVPVPIRPRRPLVELDPFAPTGVRVGELRLLPYVETSAGYETNPNQVSRGIKPSAVLRASGGVDVQSDLPTNSLTASLRGGYSEFPSNSNANRPDASGVVDGRLDVTRNDIVTLEGRFAVATQTPGSPLLAVPNSAFIVTRPLIVSEGATLGAAHRFNRLVLDLRSTFDRVQYGDALQSDGSTFRYSQDNYNDLGIVGRASYELTPEIVPFAEAGFDARVRDDAIDTSGFRRDSDGVVARAGSSFQLSRIITGTLSAGYGDRRYADPRLGNLRAPTVDGSIVYAVTPLTTLTLRANTSFSETTLAGASGAISRLVSLEIAHVFFRNFTVSGIAAYQPNQYQGVSVHEAFTQFTLKAAYNVAREVQLVASASRQNLSSTLVGNSFEDAIFLVGLRLQR